MFEALANVNWLAVIVCTIIAIVIGSVWYSPALFGKMWMKGNGWTKEDMEKSKGKINMPALYAAQIFWSLVTAVAMNIILNSAHVWGGASGALWGLGLWFGILLPYKIADAIWKQAPRSVWMVEAGNSLVTLIIFGAILGSWMPMMPMT